MDTVPDVEHVALALGRQLLASGVYDDVRDATPSDPHSDQTHPASVLGCAGQGCVLQLLPQTIV